VIRAANQLSYALAGGRSAQTPAAASTLSPARTAARNCARWRRARRSRVARACDRQAGRPRTGRTCSLRCMRRAASGFCLVPATTASLARGSRVASALAHADARWHGSGSKPPVPVWCPGKLELRSWTCEPMINVRNIHSDGQVRLNQTEELRECAR
jgi:hypothetical protein